MGQKVNPNGIRLGIVKPWNSTWFVSEYTNHMDHDYWK